MTEPSPPATLTQEERAMLIKLLFAALQVPPWTKDDLISLGKVTFAKTDIRELAEKDPALFSRLLPHLAKIVDFFWAKIMAAQNSTAPASPPAKTPATAVNTPPIPAIAQPAPAIAAPAPALAAPAPAIAAPAPAIAAPTPAIAAPTPAIAPPAPATTPSAPPPLVIMPPTSTDPVSKN